MTSIKKGAEISRPRDRDLWKRDNLPSDTSLRCTGNRQYQEYVSVAWVSLMCFRLEQQQQH